MGRYNASIVYKDGSICVAEVRDGQILRTNAIQCTGFEGMKQYDNYFRRVQVGRPFEIRLDDCAAYKEVLGRMALPPTYRTSGLKA